jgi:hypothetical protein
LLTDDGELPGIPDIEVVDVASGELADQTRAVALQQLAAVHVGFFPDHAHVVDEWREGLADGWPDESVRVHLWLLRHHGVPVGEVILHTNLRRRVVLVHFVALAAEVRRGLPRDWLESLSAGFVACGEIDAAEAGCQLRAVAGEIPGAHLHKWQPAGFDSAGVDYREPHHGMHWADFGDPEFFEMLAIVRPNNPDDAGAVGASMRGFLLDHYRLPADHPVVARILAQADGGEPGA